MTRTILAAAAAATLLSTTAAFAQASDPFLGEIILVGYTFCPRGWTEANGQLLPISQYSALFALYGTTYGGNGQTNFALPDLQGRVPMHVGNGAGLPPATLGEVGGSPEVTLTVGQLPAHTHQLLATSSPPAVPSPSGALLATFPAAQTIYSNTGAADVAMNPSAIGVAGGNQPVSLYQPYLVLRYCVATVGIFPSRN